MTKTKPFSWRLYTPHDLSHVEAAERLWMLLDSPLIKPKRFDKAQKPKQTFKAQSAKAAAKMFADGRFLFVEGEQQGFNASFSSRASAGLFAWNFFVDPAAIDGKDGPRWMEWICSLCAEFPPLFGFGCTAEEFDAKHQVIKKLPSGMVQRSAVGISDVEFERFLPGLYWMTIFGGDLVATFGAAKLLGLGDVDAIKLAGDQVVLRLKEPAKAENLEVRMAAEQKIADKIGREYFFDRTRDGVKLKPVPLISKTLKRLAAE